MILVGCLYHVAFCCESQLGREQRLILAHSTSSPFPSLLPHLFNIDMMNPLFASGFPLLLGASIYPPLGVRALVLPEIIVEKR